MNEKTELQIINLLKFTFEDAEYTKCMKYLKERKLSSLRLIVAEKYELLSMISELNPNDQILSEQVIKCDELENIVIDVYIDAM